MDFSRQIDLRGHMTKYKDTELHIRQICTGIGIIMEDASVIALIWSEYGEVNISERLRFLRDANFLIRTLLKQGEDLV